MKFIVYGKKPDPALNLPNRFSPLYSSQNVLNGWQAEIDPIRKKMRGFFLRKAELNPVMNDYDYLAQTPASDGSSTGISAGDKIRVEARVYNYSTGQTTGTIPVRFQAIRYDDRIGEEVPFTTCPNGATPDRGHCTIGETNVSSLNTLQMTTAAIVWDTSGFGPTASTDSPQYHIYVILDPPDAQHPNGVIDETYDSENPNIVYPGTVLDAGGGTHPLPQGVDPGQNNEGYGMVTITHSSLNAAPMMLHKADVFLRQNAIAQSGINGIIKNSDIPAALYYPLKLRVRVDSDRSHGGVSHLLVYDGDPEKNGEMIAAKRVHTGDVNGSYVWIDWIPRKLGKHTLYAKVLERSDDARKGNNTATLTVNVTAVQHTAANLGNAFAEQFVPT